MTARTRADLAALPGYVPGRTVPGAIKLASNETAVSPLPSVVAAVADAAAGINRYPDAGVGELSAALARKLDVPVERVITGCGSVMLLQQIVQATCVPGDEVLFAWRSFEAYPIVARVAGATPRTVALRADHTHDLDAMLAAITPAVRVVFVCNPNNPTGTAVRRAELTAFLDAVPTDVLVVLDEAYREYVRDTDVPDGVALARDRPNVVVLRTFSKAYGLAGLRVGYGVAAEPVAAVVRKVGVPFAVNALAQVAALAGLAATDELLERCRALVVERDRVAAALAGHGFATPPSEANFVWLPLGERTTAFAEHCLDHKVVVRAFAGDGARVTIGEPAENEAFLAAVAAFRG